MATSYVVPDIRRTYSNASVGLRMQVGALLIDHVSPGMAVTARASCTGRKETTLKILFPAGEGAGDEARRGSF
jgi:hypothetical protein